MRRSVRTAAAVFAIVFFLMGTGPAPLPSPDRAVMLTSTWTCRTGRGSVTKLTGTRTGQEITVTEDVQPAQGSPFRLVDRYAYDAKTGIWHVHAATDDEVTIDAIAPPWTETDWELLGTNRAGNTARMRLRTLPDGTLRRTILLENGAGSGTWRTVSSELCASGETAPPADACVVKNRAATTLRTVAPNAPRYAPSGTVVVIVSLDERSEITSARILSSPAAILNAPSLAAVRSSTFQTEVRDCKPIAADYIFSISY